MRVVRVLGIIVATAGVLAASDMATAQELQPRIGEPVPGLTQDQLDRFYLGKTAFDRTLDETEGLGPIFNQVSCGSCHNGGALGGAGTIKVTRFGAATKKGFDPLAELGGSLLQSQAIDDTCLETVPDLPEVFQINRVTNSALGAGLVEAIANGDLLIYDDPTDLDADGISGKAHIVHPLEDPSQSRVGRFGWKAQVATVLTFSADASLNELGLTNRLVDTENAPNGDLVKLAECDSVADPEDNSTLGDGAEFIDRVTDFQRFLAPPPQTPKSGMTGEQIFIDIGCAKCHVPSFTTSTTNPNLEPALAGKTVKPYSDFMLHSMGLLGDGIVQGDATELEMRTPALWGLRVRDSLLHDGRFEGGLFADRVDSAILEHQGVILSEAEAAAEAYDALDQADKDALIAFLDSLGRAEYDQDGDSRIDLNDYAVIFNCISGPGTAYAPEPHADDPCAISDLDQDGDLDLQDFNGLQRAFTGSL